MSPAGRTLWIATGNPKKRGELERMLGPLGVTVRTADEAPGGMPHVDEDQPDFAGNAQKKAAALAKVVGAPTLADDSGLCVDALDGRPGVHSARYAGPNATDRDRIDKLLMELDGVPDDRRAAHFCCSLVVCGADGSARTTIEERCRGRILPAPRGDGGFGYDPIFVADATTDSPDPPSFAQLTPEQKDAISHRGRALRALLETLRNAPQLLEP